METVRWKVVRCVEQYYYYSSVALPPAGVRYYLDCFVSAPDYLLQAGYGLLVFDSLKHAAPFLFSYGYLTHALFECEVKGALPLTPPLPHIPSPKSLSSILAGTYSWPDGTEMWTEVRLFKRITDRELRELELRR